MRSLLGRPRPTMPIPEGAPLRAAHTRHPRVHSLPTVPPTARLRDTPRILRGPRATHLRAWRRLAVAQPPRATPTARRVRPSQRRPSSLQTRPQRPRPSGAGPGAEQGPAKAERPRRLQSLQPRRSTPQRHAPFRTLISTRMRTRRVCTHGRHHSRLRRQDHDSMCEPKCSSSNCRRQHRQRQRHRPRRRQQRRLRRCRRSSSSSSGSRWLDENRRRQRRTRSLALVHAHAFGDVPVWA